jgi:formylglycine-generating enzyme required for sulfatase activity
MNYQIPASQVSVAPFYLDTREVTNREMATILDKLKGSLYVERDEDDHTLRYVRFNVGLGNVTGHLVDLQPIMGGIEHEPGVGYRPRLGREQWPANQVTWYGARLYCESVGKRLPTENEWEAAARGRADRPFPWGDERPRCGGVVVPSDEFLPMDSGCPKLDGPSDVGGAAEDVTPQGVRDLGGNVSEWVDTAYVEGDRRGATPGANESERPRVIRGGSFFFSLLARTSVRNKRPPAYVAYDVGFRCASDLVPSMPHQ